MAYKNLAYFALFLSTIFILQFANPVYAQKRTITGVVKSVSGEILPSAGLRLVNEKSSIVSFAIADKAGNYTLTLPFTESTATFWLEVVYLGYKKERHSLLSSTSVYNFSMIPDPVNLSEVYIKNRPVIERLGDTLKYKVMSFAKPEDRSIGDVLRRMPGIDIDTEGKIYHNGKQIENLYIQGDDLMDGRYGAASKIIKKEMIESVDVIKNYQPIKVLQNKSLSDKTAINLILKDENSLKLSTKVMIGAGLPGQYDGSITPILLNKRIKMINNLALNNSGIDYQADFKQLGTSNMISSMTNDQAKISLSQATIGPPDLPLSNYYFNKSGLINLNNIYNTKNGLQFKVNVQGFLDKNTLNYDSKVENYLANDTIVYHEQQDFVNKPMLLNTSFNLMINRKKYFFNNNTKIQLSKNTGNSFLNFNDNSFGQSLHQRKKEFSNDLNWIPMLGGKNIAEFRWLISYTGDKQSLDIGEGYNSQIVGQQGYYDHIIQGLKLPTLFSNAYFAYKVPGEHVNQEYKTGLLLEEQTLSTLLSFNKNEQSVPYMGDAGNDLKWNRKNIYFASEYQIKYGGLRSTVNLPLAYQDIRYNQKDYALNSKNGQFLFTPMINIRYDINPEQYISARYKYNNLIGNITSIYRGAILENYRTLQANDADLQEKQKHSAGINYDFQHSISMLFFNMGLSYDQTTANTILSTQIKDNIQKTIVLPYQNNQNNIALNAGFSKYIFDWGSTFSVKSQFNRFRYEQLINDQLLQFYSNNINLSGTVNKKFVQVLAVTYQPNILWSSSKLKGNNEMGNQLTNTTFRLDQNFKLGFNGIKKVFVELNAKHSFSSQSGNRDIRYFFLDSKIRYTPKKGGIDFNLDLTNLFNVRDYSLYSVSANQSIVNKYNIRGRMVVLRFDWYL